MPYYMSKPGVISMPKLTQTMGPWLRPGRGSYSKELSRQSQLMSSLIEQLPPFKRFVQNCHYSVTNWLPFYWSGFQQTTRYTYVIEDLSDLEAVFRRFSHAKRKNLRRASNEGVVIEWDIPCNEFYQNHKMTLSKQGNSILYSEDLFLRVYEGAYGAGQGRTIGAYDEAGNLHSAVFVVWDAMSAYDLISTIDPDFRYSGSATLLVQEVIRHAAELGLPKFDFEGSMIRSVENSFRQFGARQRPYFQLKKSNRPFWFKWLGKTKRKVLPAMGRMGLR